MSLAILTLQANRLFFWPSITPKPLILSGGNWFMKHYASSVLEITLLLQSKPSLKTSKHAWLTRVSLPTSFFLERGVQQRCCPSPTLFILAVELLAIMVCNSVEVRGLNINGLNLKLSQYADDATFFLADFPSMSHLFQLLREFALFSGLSINTHKSHLLLFPPASYEGVQMVDRVKILGVTFAKEMSSEDQYRFNFEPNNLKIKAICAVWIHRNLSMEGKVTLSNSLMISLLQFQCASTITPIRAIQEFKKFQTIQQNLSTRTLSNSNSQELYPNQDGKKNFKGMPWLQRKNGETFINHPIPVPEIQNSKCSNISSPVTSIWKTSVSNSLIHRTFVMKQMI